MLSLIYGSYVLQKGHSYIRNMPMVNIALTQSFGNVLKIKKCTCFKFNRTITRKVMNFFEGVQYIADNF